MKPVHVMVLALLAVGAGAVVWFSTLKETTTGTAVEQVLFPTLAENLDAVTQVMLSDAAGGEVTLERHEGNWVVGEKSRYFANRTKVTELVLAASEAKVIEQKTSNPEFYERLGVRNIDNADSTAVLLTLVSDAENYEVLIGNGSERRGGSTFVRKPESVTSLLVSPAISGVTSTDEWLDKAIADISADDVQSVEITDAGKVAEISKQTMVGSEFDLVGRTEEQVLNDASVRSLGRGLTGLTFEDVTKGDSFAVSDYKRKTVTYTLFSGVVIDLTLFSREPAEAESDDGPPPLAQYWLSVGARFDEALAQQFVPQPSVGVDGAEAKPVTLTSADFTDRLTEVEQFNKTRKAWVYKISADHYNNMNQSDTSLRSIP